ncbi:MAG: hypothetical protein AAF585_21230, partial [Verrucomicrobiota bacterium]
NIELFCAPKILDMNRKGLDLLDDGRVESASAKLEAPFLLEDFPAVPTAAPELKGRVGIWIHEDDLSPETSPLSEVDPVAIGVTNAFDIWEHEAYSPLRMLRIRQSISDTARRAHQWWETPVDMLSAGVLADQVTTWAKVNRLNHVVFLHPFTGPMCDAIGLVELGLINSGIEPVRVMRPLDAQILPSAKSGFFPFWKQARSKLASLASVDS